MNVREIVESEIEEVLGAKHDIKWKVKNGIYSAGPDDNGTKFIVYKTRNPETYFMAMYEILGFVGNKEKILGYEDRLKDAKNEVADKMWNKKNLKEIKKRDTNWEKFD